MPDEATPAPPPLPLPDDATQPVAHWLHTLAIVLALLLIALFSRFRAASADAGSAPLALRYSTTILFEWLLLGSVVAGLYHRREFFLQAFRNRSNGAWRSVGFGIVVYLLGFLSLALVAAAIALTPLAHQRNTAYLLAMLPSTLWQMLLWFGVSLTAGVCEELLFRGYLLQQLTAWTRRPILAIFLAAALFGSVHLYEGLGAILPLAALAVVYGFVARQMRGDLRAVIIAHTLQDFFVGFLGLARPFLERHHHLQ